MEQKLKYLEFIQTVITRMNSTSFIFKGWAITLIGALFGLGAKDANPRMAMVAGLLLPVFWGLDAFFLATERQYRALYDAAAAQTGAVDFSMNAKKYAQGRNTWGRSLFSATLLGFYGALVAVTFVVRQYIL